VAGVTRPSAHLRRAAEVIRGQHVRRLRALWTAEIATLVTAAVSGLLVARSLGPSEYGRFALLTTYAALVFAFLDPRSSELVTKYFGGWQATGRSPAALAMLRLVLLLDAAAIVVAVGITVAGRSVVQSLAPATMAELLLAAACAGLAAPVVTSRGVLAALDRYRLIAWIQTPASVLRSAALVAVVWRGGGVAQLLTVTALTMAAEAVLTWSLAARLAGRRLGAQLSSARLAELADARVDIRRFLLYSEATTFSGSIVKFSDTLMVGAFGGTAEAGYYRLAKSLTAPIASVQGPLQTVVYNRFVAVRASEGAQALGRVAKRAAWTAVPLVVLLLLCAPLMPTLVRLVGGRPFAPAGAVTVVFLVGSALALSTYWLRPYFLVVDRLGTWFWVSLGVGVTATAAFAVGAWLDGALGVAVARVLVVSVAGNGVLLGILVRDVQRLRRDPQAPVDAAGRP
jgi:O-antigen/teichoic acid export membrane protein